MKFEDGAGYCSSDDEGETVPCGQIAALVAAVAAETALDSTDRSADLIKAQHELKAAEDVISDMESELDEYKNDNSVLQDYLKERDAKIADLSSEKEKIACEIDSLKIERSDHDARIIAEHDAKMAVSVQELDLLRKSKSTADELVQQLSDSKADLNEARAKLLKSQQEFAIIKSEWEIVSDNFVEAEKDVSSKVLEIEALKEQYACEKESNTKQVAKLTAFEENHTLADQMLQEKDLELTEMQTKIDTLSSSCDAEKIDMTSELENLQKRIEDLNTANEDMQSKCNSLEEEVSSKDDALAETENELFEMRQQLETDESPVKDDGADSIIAKLKDEIETKDARITHLEKSKLTKEQLEKIKQVKEERSVLQKENKQLKKEMEKLSNFSNDKMTDAANNSKIVEETESRLMEYATERQSVMTVLEAHGISHELQISSKTDASLDHGDLCIADLLGKTLSQFQENADSLVEKVDAYKESARDSRSEIKELKMENERLQSIAANAQNIKTDINGDLVEVNKENNVFGFAS